MDWLYSNFIAGKQKAIVAFLATAVAAFCVKHGIALPNNAGDTFQALFWGLVGLVGVYVKRNQ